MLGYICFGCMWCGPEEELATTEDDMSGEDMDKFCPDCGGDVDEFE